MCNAQCKLLGCESHNRARCSPRRELHAMVADAFDGCRGFSHHDFISDLCVQTRVSIERSAVQCTFDNLPLHVQPWRVAASNVGKPTQTRPEPQACPGSPQAALVQGPANCAVAATVKVRRVARIEVCILLEVGELIRLVALGVFQGVGNNVV